MKKINSILSNISEKFVTGYKSWGKYSEIYVNPTMDEVKVVSEESNNNSFRFIADKNTKKVFISSAHTTHSGISHEIDLSDNYKNLFSAYGIYKRTKVEIDLLSMDIVDSNEILLSLFTDIKDGKYDWLSKYKFNIPEIKKNVIDGFNKGSLSANSI